MKDSMQSEALQALSAAPQTGQGIITGFQLWLDDVKAGALQNFDNLIARDKGTSREKMWRGLRDEYAELISAREEATNA